MAALNPLIPESTRDFLRYTRHALDPIFSPRTVALIGATEREGSVGRTILWNLLSSPFGGTIFPVNPKRPNVLGIKSYPDIASIPDPVDLAIIVTPARTVPGIIGECIAAGVPGAIIISAGFKEIGPEGAALEKEILEKARAGNMRIIGPNCLGVMSPVTGLNATFAASMANKGNIGFISQSGALCTAVLDWSYNEYVGFSHFVSIGSMLDVSWGDLIYYLGEDESTDAIVIYMETVGDARSFIAAAREVALTKPIIVIKAGRTAAAAKAAASHTGSLAGSDGVLDAAFRRCGVLRVDRISEMFDIAEVLAKQPRPQGNRLSIVTNAGGPGVLATDALVSGDGELAPICDETMARLNKLLPAAWSHNNPIDVLGDADPARYADTLDLLADDPNADAMLVILTPQAMTDPTETAAELARRVQARGTGKPVLASWMGGDLIQAGERILNQANIPTYPYPDTAARVFNYMWRYNDRLRALYETPVLSTNPSKYEQYRIQAQEVLDLARQAGRTILTEHESKRILSFYGIPTVETRIATSEKAAVAAAEAIGYPVVVKLHSHTITHKSDVGGVRLNLEDAVAVESAFSEMKAKVSEQFSPEDFLGVTVQPMLNLDEGYELIVGSSLDAQFGPVLLFGTGGIMVEVYKDSALALPPLNTTLARRMMERTKIYQALKGVRGREAVDLGELEKLMARFSQLVVEQTWIKEIDINPLLASSERLIALDARILLHDPDTDPDQLPRPAIRPYPSEYVTSWRNPTTGVELTFRPIRPEDEPMMVEFHRRLSEETVRMRYDQPLELQQRVAHERLAQVCFADFERQIVLVAERTSEDQTTEILAVARLSKVPGTNDATFGLLVRDEYQGTGLGTALLGCLLEIGRKEGVRDATATFREDNTAMKRISGKLGFVLSEGARPDLLVVTRPLA
ncbi:MAG: bifunctional acetate--CoA ligase family protein/GNAT family N-acetyltransferase [Chloroflexi bacterium]|nr:bifunctional acetate--CoA ligase family protein/GNAT family N-acetyltransferase [Chloroflexota bacterium]